MFGLATGELLTILLVATLMFGAKRLPELGRNLGHGMRGFRDALRGEDEPASGAQPERQPRPPQTPGPRNDTNHPGAPQA